MQLAADLYTGKTISTTTALYPWLKTRTRRIAIGNESISWLISDYLTQSFQGTSQVFVELEGSCDWSIMTQKHKFLGLN